MAKGKKNQSREKARRKAATKALVAQGVVGRPNDYNPLYCELATKYALLGLTDQQMADVFGVATATLYKWQHEHPEFSEAIKAGKVDADAVVAQSMYRKATGYTVEIDKVIKSPEGGQQVVKVMLHVPADTMAGIYWLNNRRRQNWRQRQEITGKDGEPIAIEDKTQQLDVKDLEPEERQALRKALEAIKARAEAKTIEGSFSEAD